MCTCFATESGLAMRLKTRKKIPLMIRTASLLLLAAALCLAGCGAGTGQGSTVAQGAGQGSSALHPEDMGLLCFFRYEKGDNYDADMEILEGRVNALTDGSYLKEDTTVDTPEGTLDAVNFYVPKEVYGEYSLRDISRILINRPMNLWLSDDTGDGPQVSFGDIAALPRDGIESVEMLYGCPESFNPPDFGMKQKEFNYLKITLTEEFCSENPQVLEWKQPNILQDIEGLEGYAHMRVFPDAENRCMIFAEKEDQPGYSKALYYSYTHEPLSAAFHLIALPIVEWESGDEIKGARQIENTGFKTATVVNEYAPKETYVSDRNWDQTLQAIRERLDAAGFPYALGHRPGVDHSIVIRMEEGLFSDKFLDYVVKNTLVTLTAYGEVLQEAPSSIQVSSLDRSGKKALALDMSALRKEAFSKLSMNCMKKGGGRIVLCVNEIPFAYGNCDKVINDGKFVMTCNAFSAEDGFAGEMAWMPDFLTALISGTQFPIILSSTPAVTLENIEQIYLTEDGQLYMAELHSIPRENLYAAFKRGIGDLEWVYVGILTSGKPCIQFALPEEAAALPEEEASLPDEAAALPEEEISLPDEEETSLPQGASRNAQIASMMSQVFRGLRDEIFTYWMAFDFVDASGNSVLRIITYAPNKGDKTKFRYSIYCKGEMTEEDTIEIRRLLAEDTSLADLVETEE